MSLFPYSSLFISTLVSGSLISLSSNHWILIWVGFELNLISFIPLMFLSHLNSENEAAMKYFLSQALGSSLILVGASNLYFSTQSIFPQFFSTITIMSGLLVKLGMPPCHFWFPSVMSFLSWPLCFILSTWQKVAPLFILIHLTSIENFYILFFLVLLSSLIGGLGGLSQSLLKPLLAFSSIGHMSWMIAASMYSFSTSIMYFLFYSIISFSVIVTLYVSNTFSISSLNSSSNSSFFLMLALILSMLSLGGVPPFLGFFPKWLVIQSTSIFSFLIPVVLILGSLINLFYYLNIIFITLINSSSPLFFLKNSISPSSWPVILASSSIILAPTFFFIL